MADELEEIAQLLGATIVGQVPDVGGGALGAAHLAKVYQARMVSVRAQPQHEATAQGPILPLEVPLSKPAEQALAEIATWASQPGQSVVPAQLAGDVLEKVLPRLAEAIRQTPSGQTSEKKQTPGKTVLEALDRLLVQTTLPQARR